MTTNRLVKRMIDIGANLTDPMFRGTYHSSQRHKDDFDDMLNRSFNNGLERIIITGGSLSESKSALELARGHERLYSTVGCHPTRCDEFNQYPDGADSYLEKLSELATDKKVVAIGEVGLDYDRLQFCSKEVQRIYFERQLELADTTKLPLFLHNRNSIDDFVTILERNKSKLGAGGVVHSFDGSLEDAKRVMDLGFHIGINGCSLKTDANLEVVKQLPEDKLMIETDCPWCEIKRTHASFKYVTTIPDRSKNATDPKLPVKNRNEPMNLVQVLEVLSALRGQEIGPLSEQIYANTIKLFFNK